MASLIKNQIVKHLSKYAKNLNPDNISVDVLKGKGALHNIELNEVLLTEILELPAWLSIERVVCSTVALKVPWTSLKTVPIVLFMDEVKVDVVMSSNLRATKPSSSSSGLSYSNMDYAGYGFVNKVIEGMTLNINSLEIKFSSEYFGGSLTLNQLQVASCTPYWKVSPSDLHQTRVKETCLNEVLIFKLLTWQLLRVEASSLTDSTATAYNVNAPLRFITSQGRAQITVKKSTVSGAVSAGRIQIILNDLLWVATLSQVRSAISFYQYILKLIQQATDLHKKDQLDSSLAKNSAAHNDAPVRPVVAAVQQSHPRTLLKNPIFDKFDIVQSSYHFYADCIDLHICDETNSDISYPESWDFKSGALQVTLTRLVCDFYPYHLVAGDRKHWVYYNESKGQVWMKQLLAHYFEKFSSEDKFNTTTTESALIWSQIKSLCCLIRLYDLKLYCVSESSEDSKTGQNKKNGGKLQQFLSADKEILQLPGEPPPLITFEFNNYYLPFDYGNFPVPPYSTHVQMNPVLLYIDLRTVRWMSFVYLDLCKTLGLDTSSVEFVPHSDVRIEAIMPRMIVPLQDDATKFVSNATTEHDRIVVSTSLFVLTNIQIDISDEVRSNRLIDYVEQLRNFRLFSKLFETSTVSPNGNIAKFNQIPQRSDALHLYFGKEFPDGTNSKIQNELKDVASKLDALRLSALNDVWMLEVSPLWVDFVGARVSRTTKSTPFLLDVSFNAWSFMGTKLNASVENADFYFILKPAGCLKLILDKVQYSFLMRLADQVNNFTTMLNNDSKCFYETMQPKSLVVLCLCPEVEIKLILLIDSHLHHEPRQEDGKSETYAKNGAITTSVEISRNNSVVPTGNVIPRLTEPSPLTSASPSDSSISSSFNEAPPSIQVQCAPTVSLPGIHRQQDQLTGSNMSLTKIFEIHPAPSKVQQQEDAFSIHTDISDEDILQNSTTSSSMCIDVIEDQESMFLDIFASLARERRNMAIKNRQVADLAEEAVEIAINNDDTHQRFDSDQFSVQKAYTLTCVLTEAQCLLTCYDRESYLTIQSPCMDLLKQNQTVRDLNEIYMEFNTKGANVQKIFDGDLNDHVLRIQSVTDGNDVIGRIDVEVKNAVFTVNADYVNYLTDFIRLDDCLETSVEDVAQLGQMRMLIKNLNLELADNKAGSTFVHVDKAQVHQGITKEKFQDDMEHAKLTAFPVSSKMDEVNQRLEQLGLENVALRRQLSDATKIIQQLNQNSQRL